MSEETEVKQTSNVMFPPKNTSEPRRQCDAGVHAVHDYAMVSKLRKIARTLIVNHSDGSDLA
jgi:hypothetical protein